MVDAHEFVTYYLDRGHKEGKLEALAKLAGVELEDVWLDMKLRWKAEAHHRDLDSFVVCPGCREPRALSSFRTKKKGGLCRVCRRLESDAP